MRVKLYDGTNNHHNLAKVVLAKYFYEAIYNKGLFVVPAVVTVYDTTIDIMDAMNVVKRS